MENIENSKREEASEKEELTEKTEKVEELPETKEELDKLKRLLEFKETVSEQLDLEGEKKEELISHMEKFMEDGLEAEKGELNPKQFFEKIVSDEKHYTNENIYLNSELFQDNNKHFSYFNYIENQIQHMQIEHLEGGKFKIDLYFEKYNPVVVERIKSLKEKITGEEEDLYKLSYEIGFYIRT